MSTYSPQSPPPFPFFASALAGSQSSQQRPGKGEAHNAHDSGRIQVLPPDEKAQSQQKDYQNDCNERPLPERHVPSLLRCREASRRGTDKADGRTAVAQDLRSGACFGENQRSQRQKQEGACSPYKYGAQQRTHTPQIFYTLPDRKHPRREDGTSYSLRGCLMPVAYFFLYLLASSASILAVV